MDGSIGRWVGGGAPTTAVCLSSPANDDHPDNRPISRTKTHPFQLRLDRGDRRRQRLGLGRVEHEGPQPALPLGAQRLEQARVGLRLDPGIDLACMREWPDWNGLGEGRVKGWWRPTDMHAHSAVQCSAVQWASLPPSRSPPPPSLPHTHQVAVLDERLHGGLAHGGGGAGDDGHAVPVRGVGLGAERLEHGGEAGEDAEHEPREPKPPEGLDGLLPPAAAAAVAATGHAAAGCCCAALARSWRLLCVCYGRAWVVSVAQCVAGCGGCPKRSHAGAFLRSSERRAVTLGTNKLPCSSSSPEFSSDEPRLTRTVPCLCSWCMGCLLPPFVPSDSICFAWADVG